MIRSRCLSDGVGGAGGAGGVGGASLRVRAVSALLAAAGACFPALGSGSGENALLVIDPTNAASMYVGNYYKNARNIPDSNVLYLTASGASDYQQWVGSIQQAFLATLDQRAIADHIDYVVLAPSNQFYVPAAGLVNDTCSR